VTSEIADKNGDYVMTVSNDVSAYTTYLNYKANDINFLAEYFSGDLGSKVIQMDMQFEYHAKTANGNQYFVIVWSNQIMKLTQMS
jgi:hypothetical protein